MDKFREMYATLNSEQRQAVDTVDGPMLVIAGPGTGKTQLLSARVANILQKTDTSARNILCLTFTENGAENMRQRLSQFIGQAAYEVTISTYHAFGSELIRRFPEYFTETRLQSAIDELSQRQIIADLVEGMSYANPLKQTRHHLGDLTSTISEVKRALLTPDALRAIAKENLAFIHATSRDIREPLADFVRMPSIKQALPLFEQLLAIINSHAPSEPVNAEFGSLAQAAITSLQTALAEAGETNRTTPLTDWKNSWLVKDGDNRFVLAGELEARRIQALADVLEQYQAALATRGLYDFDDMIIRAVEALATNNDLRYTLQEQYLYILLDEFQDTNTAQFKLVQLLTDNPVHEGRPNVMAVGDDDQAIYAFQGAQHSNMLDFYHAYRDVAVVNLIDNYRSHPDILEAAQNVAGQITERLQQYFEGTTKILRSSNTQLPKQATITRCEFLSGIAQADWLAREVKKLIAAGTNAREIAVLAPRHRQLEPLVPYLNALGVPVRYEKRENILEAPVVKQLITMSRLVLALLDNDDALADSLWPEVLSYDFWKLATSSIWQISWQVAEARANGTKLSWSQALLADGKRFRAPALLMLTLANKVGQETCETMLDYLVGTSVVETNEQDLPKLASPLRDYYTDAEARRAQPELFYDTLTHLTVLRARLRDHQATSETALNLQDLINFVDLYQAADERLSSTSPYNQRADAVQLMTVFKAKGLEFEHVFLVNLEDEVWGSTSRGQANRLTLPANLVPIRHAGATDDERLRILFVAITRAKFGLYLTNVAQSYTGKATRRLKYLDERDEDGITKDFILPEHARTVDHVDTEPPAIELLELDWRRRHQASMHQASLSGLLRGRLANYQLSPTHLSTFLDIAYGGPERFFFNTILRFPETPSMDIQFGNAVHETLQWVQYMTTERTNTPDIPEALEYFTARMRQKKLSPERTTIEIERGNAALAVYLTTRSHMFTPADKAEMSFKNEGIFVGDAHLAGKVDRLEIDHKNKTITVVDYKTGKSFSRWESEAKLHHYRRQLYCYKLLVERSVAFRGYRVTHGRLEFVEPDKNGRINTLELAFEEAELKRLEQLIIAVWNHVQQLKFPSITSYDASLAGVRQLEQDLLDNKL